MTPRHYVNQLANGDAVEEIFLIADRQLRVNRQGNLYLQLALRDRTGTVDARLWNATENLARRFEPGGYVAVRGKVQLHQGAPQVIIATVDPVDPDGVEAAEFLPESPNDIPGLTSRLRHLLMSLGNPSLRALAECFLIDDDFVSRFTAAPAGVSNHHAYRGGLLEHVVTMMSAADRIVDLYPSVDRDLLLCGIFLHDVGKIDELSYGQAFSYTDEGQLIGHLVLGLRLLDEKIERASELTAEPFPRELRLRLEHMILSHHGALEYGSPKLPMTPEAIALHYLDNLDAKVHLFAREIANDPARDSSWTPYNAGLQRRLFKGSRRSEARIAESAE